jgi:hypothetical protein
VTDSEQIEELKTGLLLYIPYRANGGAGLQGFDCRRPQRLHTGAGPGLPAHRPGGSRLTGRVRPRYVTPSLARRR